MRAREGADAKEAREANTKTRDDRRASERASEGPIERGMDRPTDASSLLLCDRT